MSLSAFQKAAVGLVLALGGLAWVAWASESSAAGSSVQGVDASAKRLALTHWRAYMTRIGWPQDRVRAEHPDFLDTITQKTRRPDGGWTIVFDGSRHGEIRTVTMELDDRGHELGDPVVEWADTFEIADLF